MEDGVHDMWRRTIMKFYSRILGDRDYSLFEVLHFGLRLPGVLSSFGEVPSASVANWATVKRGRALAAAGPSERATHRSALESFGARSLLRRSTDVSEADLCDLSFYAFWRQYDVVAGRLIRKRREKVVAVTGAGWPSHAKRTHEHHESYARKTLYAYMPCAGLAGTEYVDAAVRRHYAGSFARALQAFVADPENIWCPKWIRRNYQVLNRESTTSATTAAAVERRARGGGDRGGGRGACRGGSARPVGRRRRRASRSDRRAATCASSSTRTPSRLPTPRATAARTASASRRTAPTTSEAGATRRGPRGSCTASSARTSTRRASRPPPARAGRATRTS
jgi:hypothetical protein